MSIEIDSLEIKVQAGATDASTGIDRLTAALSSLKNITKGGAGLTAVANQLTKLNTALSGVSVNTGKMGEVAAALNSLADVQKASGLASTVTALKKLPQISKDLESADLGKFATQMNQVAAAVRPLATEMQKVSNGFSAFPIRIQKIISANTGLAASNHATGKSFGVMGTGISGLQAKFGIYYMAFKRIANQMSEWVTESNDYVENLNLFNVAMGDAAAGARTYAEEVRNAIGIDPSEWMRNQGMFKQITSGFGVVSEKANLMSKNLTQLGYDMSSFFNAPIGDAMQKVQSGIAGELEPLRRWGYALDVATLQEIAYKNGIDMKVNAMTQAQKSQLRYLAIMEQSGNVMGDMARTVQTPANAMRILNQQITQLCRALGNLLIPFLQMVIPYVQAFVEVLTEAIQSLAVMVGFELPTIDYSGLDGVTSGAGDAEDALGGASNAAKELKNATLGIDELNILPDQQPAGGSGASGGAGGDLGLDLPEYDFLAGLQDKTDAVKKQMEAMLGPIAAVAGGLAAWKIAKDTLKFFNKTFPDLLSKNSKIKNFAGAFSFAAGEVSFLYGALKQLVDGEASWETVAETVGGSLLAVAGAGLMLGPKGAAVTAVVNGAGTYLLALKDFASGNVTAESVAQGLAGLTTASIGLAVALGSPVAGVALALGGLILGIGAAFYGMRQEAAMEEVASRFGDIALSAEELKEVAAEITESEYLEKMKIALEDISELDSKFEGIKAAFESIQKLTLKAEIYGELDEESSASLKEQLDKYIEDSTSYLEGLKQTTTVSIAVALEPIGGTDNPFVTGIINLANYSITNMQSELDSIGLELGQVYMEAMADGIITADEAEAIAELQKKYQSILDAASDSKYEAKMLQIQAKNAGLKLTPESFVQMQNELNEQVSQKVIDIDTSSLALSEPVIAAINNLNVPDNVKDTFKTAVSNAFQESAAIESLDITMKSVNVQTATLKEAFSTELTNMAPELSEEVAGNAGIQDVIRNLLNNPNVDQVDSAMLEEQMKTALSGAFLRLSPELASLATEANISQEMFDKIQVSEEQMQALRQKFIDAGIQVPQALKDGISDAKQLEALRGTEDDIYYMLGQQMAESNPEVENLLMTSKAFGNSLPTQVAEGIAAKYDLVKDAGTGLYTELQLTATGQEMETLIKTLNEKGQEIGKAIPDEMLAQLDLVREAGTGLIKEVANGINDEKDTTIDSATNAAKAAAEAIDTATGVGTQSSKTMAAGKGLMTDFRGSIVQNQDLPIGAATDAANGVNNALDKVDGFNSLSDACNAHGVDVCNSFANGIEGNASAVTTSMDTLLNALLGKMETFTNRCRTALNGLLGDYASAMASVKVSTEGKVSYSRVAPVYIQGFASGGFPEMGQLFLANEAGPELVGTIGGQTAVANNDQIEAGIYRAAMSANAEQNALLRRQNEILMELLEKDGQVYLDSRDITDRQGQVSRMYRR